MTFALTDIPAYLALAIIVGAAMIDMARFEIPNAASIAVIGLAVVHGALAPAFSWWPHLLAPVLMFAFGLLAFSRGWLGGGDVKLMTALAAWTGLSGLPLLFLAISMAGGALTLVLLTTRLGSPLAGAPAGGRPRIFQRGEPIPYAVAIALGLIWWIWATHGGPLSPR